MGVGRHRLPAWLRTRERRPRLLEELHRFQQGRVRPIHAKALPYWLRAAIIGEFGSVNHAKKLLGLATIRVQPLDPARVVPDIKKLHAVGKSLASSHVPLALVSAAQRKYGSWRGAIEAAGIDFEQLGLKVKRHSDDALIDWLRALAKEQPTMTLVELAKERKFNPAVTRFGGLPNALKRAGIKDWPIRQKPRWTKQSIIAAMRALAREGKSMSAKPTLCQAATRHFGSLQAAAQEAGVQTRAPRTRSREEVVATLRRIARKHGTVTHALAKEAGIDSAVKSVFGTLTDACEAARVVGYERMLTERHAREEDPEALLEELRAIAKRLERPVMRRDLSFMFHQALLRQFESLDAGRDRAGLPQPELPRRWTRKIVLDALRAEHRRGTRMTQDGLVEAGRGDLAAAIGTYLGTLANARRLARIPTPVPLKSSHVPFLKVWDEDRVIDEIEARVKAGQSLVPVHIPRPLMSAACRYWGSWRTAVEIAGHDYTKHLLRRDRTDEELLDLLRTIAERRPHMTLEQLRQLPFCTTLHRRFGTPHAAAERAGLEDWPKRETLPVMSKQELRDLLHARLRTGKRIRSRDVDGHVRFSMTRIHPRWSIALARLGIGVDSRVTK